MAPEVLRDIEAGCARTMMRLIWCLDERRYEELAGLFCPEGVWHRDGKALKGRQEILAALQARPSQWVVRHVASNFYLEAATPREASVGLYLTAYLYDGASPAPSVPVLSGPYRFAVVKATLTPVGNDWKIVSQTNIRQFEFNAGSKGMSAC